MKNHFKLILLTLLTLSFAGCKNDNNFSIEGTIEGEYAGYIYLKYNGMVDSTVVRNNQFRFEGKVDHPVEASFKQSANHPVTSSFYFSDEDLKVIVATEQYFFVVKEISGSPTMILVEETINDIGALLDEDRNPNQKLYAAFKKLISENPDNPFVGEIYVELVTEANLLTLEQVNELSAMLKPSALDESSSNSLKLATDRMNKINVGDPFPFFEYVTKDNQEITLNTFKGDYLLIDFWASWCGPCVEAIPTLQATLNKYTDKNFSILGFSLDESKDTWIKTLEKLNPTWPQVIDTNGWGSEFAEELGVVFLPFNYLIGPDGNIVAINIRAKNLEAELEKLMSID